MQQKSTVTAEPGDIVAVHGHSTGEAERTGVILEVLGAPGHKHYRVRWDEEHESLFWPASDATVRPGTRRRRRATSPGVGRAARRSNQIERAAGDVVPDPEC